jgi:hypothetical protein
LRATLSDHPVDTGRESTTGPALDESDPRVQLLVQRITKRLRPVCAGWEEDRFQTLVQKIARMRVRWGDLDGDNPHHFD